MPDAEGHIEYLLEQLAKCNSGRDCDGGAMGEKMKWEVVDEVVDEVLDWGREVMEWDNAQLEMGEVIDLLMVGEAGEEEFLIPEKEGLRKLRKSVTVDSGAAVCVADPDDVPEYPLESSEGSRKGQVFAGCGKERLKILGQKKFPVMTKNGELRGLCMQAAKVRKPLLAVSAACDKEQFVFFDNDGSVIADRNCAEAVEIRRLVKLIKEKIELRRENGVYLFDAWVVPPGFTGQGQ